MGDRAADAQRHVWAIVLAGGEGDRLRPLIQRLYGQDRPKQFAALLGSRCLFRQTLDRLRLFVPAERIVVVTCKGHEGYVAEALDGAPVGRVLVQPENRGTAAAVLLPAYWINGNDADAVVTICPADHFVHEEEAFTECVADLVGAVSEHADWIGLLGATPTEPDPDYGWIEPGEIVAWSPAGNPIHRVRQFWEKPFALAAQGLIEKGWLWSTAVLAARASVLVEVAGRLRPGTALQISAACPLLDTDQETWALQHAYASIRKESFSSAFLERCSASLVVYRLPALTWSDWGTQERVVASLRRARLLPPWFGESDLAVNSPPSNKASLLARAVR